ncbi:hypothetical protein DOTSEDRAFT_67913 [Dothistroma septosporum NZE10]|uniref:Uncharacterized protein n=1 Tax=Dothistroma septosporum (strain NZE10 / CBS 128990) TaxID=675120 RepID=N1Q3L1_DOTSN|nr:hypothetical protein DOTSEDRAFT_67913 [Dothistroma septosporum NZE10]
MSKTGKNGCLDRDGCGGQSYPSNKLPIETCMVRRPCQCGRQANTDAGHPPSIRSPETSPSSTALPAIMAPQIPSLAQSESKSKFFERLDLSKDDPADKHLYALMKVEAANGRKRLVESHSSYESINETAMHREILNIYQHACRQTKSTYDQGRDTDGVEEENWIVRWLLWHAFRYRDQRNNRDRRPFDAGEEGAALQSSSNTTTPASSSEPSCTPASRQSEGSASSGRFWDPVRNNWHDS